MNFNLYLKTLILFVFLTATAMSEPTQPDPGKDVELIQGYFMQRFPDIPLAEFSNGVYALDMQARENWEALEEFPPYEMHIDNGSSLWEKDLDVYIDCFPQGPAIKHQYPQWNETLNTVVTLPLAINLCRSNASLAEYEYMSEQMNSLVAYLAYQSRGQIINIQVPNDKALSAYQAGKKFYFTRRGQLNFACFHCHFDNAGKKLRTESLGPALGQTTGWPTYRNKWGALGPLHRRYIGCNNQVRAAPLAAQSETYRNLEYFHTHMNNGLPINGPSVRR